MNTVRHSAAVLNTVIIFMTLATCCFSQNLVPNPDFEVYSECPENVNNIDKAVPWVQGNEAIGADHFHICSSGNAGIPDNSAGNQWPVSGVGYAGTISRSSNIPDYREYIRAPLENALGTGQAYLVSFYVSAGDNWCRTTAIGALFTVDTPVYNDNLVLPYFPQIEVNGDFIGDFNNWTFISRCFIADGGEQYITIGNFRDDSNCGYEPWCGQAAFYYIDQVSVVEMPLSEQTFVIDPLSACDSIEIDPGIAQAYLWQDGTTNPTLMVYESGTYYVTLSDECAFQYGEVEVTIIPTAPPVALPGDSVLCTGESFEIVLDEDAGDYLWHDGTQNSSYTIAASGLYSVSLTDACETTSDTIEVLFLDAPGFSLGPDTLICDGDAFTLSFDPQMGDFLWQDGSTASTYTINGDGTYALTVTNICGQAEDAIDVDFVEALDIDIGPDQSILCAGESIEIELDPDLGDFLWHDGSMGNTYTVTNAGLVSVQVTNACETAGDEMLVNVLLPPQFTLGPDLTVCEGQFPLTFDFSNVDDAQEWEWSDGSGQSVYQVTGPGIYGLTISNDCFAETDSIEITVGDADPVVMLPPDQLLCPGDSILLDAGGIQGDYVWLDISAGSMPDTVSISSSYVASDSGSYVLQVSNICGMGTDTIEITYTTPLQPPDLGVDFSLCPGETAVLYAGVSGVSYAWQDTSTGSVTYADSLLVAQAGVYVLEIADACTTALDTIVVAADGSPPSVDLPNTIDLCEGDTVVLDAGIAGVGYLWQDGSVASQYLATLPGIYYVQVSNACGMDSDTTVVIDAGPAPSVDLGPDVGICAGDTILLMPSYSDVESWLWNDSSVETRLIASLPGTYYVQVSNQCGQVSDTIEVLEFGSAPIVDLGIDTLICQGDTVILMPQYSDVESWLWHDGTVEPQNLAALPGIYYVDVSNICGSDSDTIIISDLGPPPTVDLGPDLGLCPGDTIILSPTSTDVMTWTWQDGSVEPQHLAALPGIYHLQVSNPCGTASDTIEIVLDPNGPEVDLGPDVLACEGDTVILDAGISGVDYLWQDGSVGSRFIATLTGTYSLHVSNACGADSDTIIVNIHGSMPTPVLGPDTTLCWGEALELISAADSLTSIEWSDGSTVDHLFLSAPGTYWLTETNHCGTASDTIEVEFADAPAPFDLGEDMVICPGDMVILTAPQTDDMIVWETPDGTSISSVTAVAQPGLVILTISNECGIVSDDIVIAFDPSEPEVVLDPVSLCAGESIILDVTQPFDAEYIWSTGSTSPVLQIASPGSYAVSVQTACYAVEESVQITASADCDLQIYVPNVFSPNGDNINDVWEVHIDPAMEFDKIECTIFDRWGNTIFTSTIVPVEWDGSYNGEMMLPGVYVFVFELRAGDEARILSGSLTLVR